MRFGLCDMYDPTEDISIVKGVMCAYHHRGMKCCRCFQLCIFEGGNIIIGSIYFPPYFHGQLFLHMASSAVRLVRVLKELGYESYNPHNVLRPSNLEWMFDDGNARYL
jgi:hypothetical protein